jgi:hypothetical protein
MKFHLQLLQTKETKQHLFDVWKWGVVEAANQGVSS